VDEDANPLLGRDARVDKTQAIDAEKTVYQDSSLNHAVGDFGDGMLEASD